MKGQPWSKKLKTRRALRRCRLALWPPLSGHSSPRSVLSFWQCGEEDRRVLAAGGLSSASEMWSLLIHLSL